MYIIDTVLLSNIGIVVYSRSDSGFSHKTFVFVVFGLCFPLSLFLRFIVFSIVYFQLVQFCFLVGSFLWFPYSIISVDSVLVDSVFCFLFSIAAGRPGSSEVTM